MPGLEVSRRGVLHDRQIEGLIRHNPFQPLIFLFQRLQPFSLIHTQAAILLFPPIVRVFRDPERSAHLTNGHPFARFELDRAQMLDDVFRRVRLCGAWDDLLGSGSRLTLNLDQFCPARSAFLGSICGITLSYGLGRRFGPSLIHRV